MAESLEWDMYGTELSSTYDDAALNLSEQPPSPIRLDRVCNLNNNLPLTSTWNTLPIPNPTVPTAPPRRRINLPRRPLPREVNHPWSFLPRFVHRLNPFKKRNS